MSLVSYADSDDSGEEDVGKPEVQESVTKNENKVVEIKATNVQTKAPLRPNKAQQENIDADGSDVTKPKSIGSLFSSLPAPWMSTVTWANKSSGIKKKGANVKEQTVKITLPSLDNDSDSDEEEYIKKVTSSTNSQKATGLFLLLPKPKNSVVVKENNPNRPVAKISNRPLIPDSLRRKQTKKLTPQVRKAQTKDDGSDEDSDDDGKGSFFSWNEPKAGNASTSQVTLDVGSTSSVDKVGEIVTQTTTSGNILPPSNDAYIRSETIQETKTTENAQNCSQAPAAAVSDAATHSEYLEHQNFYTASKTQGYSYPTEYSGGSYQTNSEMHTEANYPYPEYYSTEQYNQQTTEQGQNYPGWQTAAQLAVQEPPEQFKELLGKRGRGEENIDIIDVNVDDQVGSSQEWKTNYQKEDADYKPQSKKKGNLPSSQQRRKHQITYLAFQAKEKEWELRNQWSANRQTKRQTQSKYGF